MNSQITKGLQPLFILSKFVGAVNLLISAFNIILTAAYLGQLCLIKQIRLGYKLKFLETWILAQNPELPAGFENYATLWIFLILNIFMLCFIVIQIVGTFEGNVNHINLYLRSAILCNIITMMILIFHFGTYSWVEAFMLPGELLFGLFSFIVIYKLRKELIIKIENMTRLRPNNIYFDAPV